jgi:hypothetical protein
MAFPWANNVLRLIARKTSEAKRSKHTWDLEFGSQQRFFLWQALG